MERYTSYLQARRSHLERCTSYLEARSSYLERYTSYLQARRPYLERFIRRVHFSNELRNDLTLGFPVLTIIPPVVTATKQHLMVSPPVVTRNRVMPDSIPLGMHRYGMLSVTALRQKKHCAPFRLLFYPNPASKTLG